MNMNKSVKRDEYSHDNLVTNNTSIWLNWGFHIEKQGAVKLKWWISQIVLAMLTQFILDEVTLKNFGKSNDILKKTFREDKAGSVFIK